MQQGPTKTVTRQSSRRVSVIMPCYNAAAYVAEAVEDVLAQTHRQVELIVVDDGSTDGSADIVAGYGPPVRLIRQSNAGCSAARNAGLACATGTYVAFLDADDRWDHRFLETMIEAIEAEPNEDDDPRPDLVYCGWARFWGNLDNARPFVPQDLDARGRDKLALMLQCCPFPIHAVLVRLKKLREVGGFDRRFPPAEDYHLWLRLATRCRFRRVPKVMAYYRRHPNQQTADHYRPTLKRWRMLRDFVETHRSHLRHIPREELSDWVNDVFRREGYAAYSRWDLSTARRCFRRMAGMGRCRLDDLKVVLPSFLPLRLHQHLLLWRDAANRDEDVPAVMA
ncbi:MAG: glycosyltransferase [Phycisphaerae bacterium]|nr:glycosyltransferase [Phycisphaerae bacterium]